MPRRRHPSRSFSSAGPSLLIALALLAGACGGGDDDGAAADRTATSVRITVADSTSTGGATQSATAEPTTDASDGDAAADGAADGGAGTGTGDQPADGGTDAGTTSAPPETPGGDPDAWPAARYRLVEVASVEFPTTLIARAGSDDLWVAEREGRVRRLERRDQGFTVDPSTTLDIAGLVGTEGEGGLLGMTFSADGQRLYVSYTDNDGDSVLTEYPMVGDRADEDSSRVLFQLEQPFSNHNGGQVERGPDGLLYLGFGDGGSGGDPLDSGQDTNTLLGSILRIDPENPGGEAAYGIPADNPFADGNGGRPEIWLYGVRNPWRFSFDRANGDLWIGDVGQNAIEEITHLRATGGPAGRGANLGWRLVEGNQSFEGGSAPADHSAPIYTYGRDGGCSVTGGYVYRGRGIPALEGVYLFGDFCAGQIIGLQTLDDGAVLVGDVVTDRGVGQIVSFGQDADGEVYVLGSGGSVSRLEADG